MSWKIIFKKQLFDLEVKGQGPTKVIMVCDTPPYGHAPTYQIQLTYLERQKSYGPDKLCWEEAAEAGARGNIIIFHFHNKFLKELLRKGLVASICFVNNNFMVKLTSFLVSYGDILIQVYTLYKRE
jgi:hypothetical protein